MEDPTKITPQDPEPTPAPEPEPAPKPADPNPTPDPEPADPAKPTDPPAPAEPDYKAQAAEYAARAVQAEARAALAALGVPAAKLSTALKLADLSGINPADKGAPDAIAKAAEAVLAELPELRGGAGTGAAVATQRKTAENDPFLKGFLGEK